MKHLFKKIIRKMFPPSMKKIERFLICYKNKSIYPEVLSVDETIDLIIEKHMSLSRFGDGEFSLCFNKSIKFQDNDNALKRKLCQILKVCDDSNCLISIPEFRGITRHTDYWKNYWFENIENISTLLNKNYKYGNAGVTREIKVHHLMKFPKIWDKKIGVFIFGKDSHFELIPQLFDNLTEKHFINGLSKNSWSCYDEILSEAKKYFHFENCIFLISLGPTATVLAYELAYKGKQAIDIGHISNIYNHLVHQEKIPEKLQEVN